MKPLQYVTSIVANIEKGTLEKETKQTRHELVEAALPNYASASDWLNTYTLKSPEAKKFQELFSRGVRTSFRGNFVQVINQALQRASEHLDKIDGLIKSEFAQDVMREGLTFFKTAILQHQDAISFLATYSNRLLIWVYTVETEAAGTPNRSSGLAPAELKWLETNRDDFFKVVELFDKTVKDLEAGLGACPNIVVNEESSALVASARGIKATDPFMMGFVKNVINPFLFVGKFLAEIDVDRYNAAKEYRTTTELKLLRLKQLQNGQEDAKLDAMIEHHENELRNIHRKIQKWESDYA